MAGLLGPAWSGIHCSVFYPVQGAARSTSLGLMSLGGATSRACGAVGLGLPGVQVMQKAP